MHVLAIHGVGEQAHDFANEARLNLKSTLAKHREALYFASAHWAPIADQLEHKFLRTVEKRGSKGNVLQKLFTGTAADAIVYLTNPRLREQLFYLLDYEMGRLRVDDATVICHSLGCLIFTDYMRERPGARIGKLVTMGCNVGWFTMGQRFRMPRNLASTPWLNVFDSADGLGFPLGGDPALAHVEDVEVRLGNFLTRWNVGATGLSHLMYWGDSRLFKKTLPRHLRGY